MIFFTILLLFICQNVIAEHDITVEEGNALVNEFVEALQNHPELEPMQLPNHTVTILNRILFIRTEFKIVMTEGEVFGLSKITREKDVILEHDNNSSLIISHLNFPHINVKYLIRVILFSRGRKPFYVDSYMSNNKIVLKLQVNKSDNTISVVDLKVDRLSGFRVHIEKFGNLFKWLENAYKTIIVNLLKQDITVLVQEKLRKVFEEEAAKRNE